MDLVLRVQQLQDDSCGGSESAVLTQVSALDGAVAEGDAEVVTCLPQLGNGNSVRAADYPRLVIILPFSAEARAHSQMRERAGVRV